MILDSRIRARSSYTSGFFRYTPGGTPWYRRETAAEIIRIGIPRHLPDLSDSEMEIQKQTAGISHPQGRQILLHNLRRRAGTVHSNGSD